MLPIFFNEILVFDPFLLEDFHVDEVDEKVDLLSINKCRMPLVYNALEFTIIQPDLGVHSSFFLNLYTRIPWHSK